MARAKTVATKTVATKKTADSPVPASFADNDQHNRSQGLIDDGLVEREPRGEKKRRAWQLENLGEAIVKLSPGKLARMELPEDLRAAVDEARRIVDSRGGYRRQIQFIGKIMRTVDAVPIADQLEALAHEGTFTSPTVRAAELWRTRLLSEGDAALTALVAEYAHADATHLRQLVRAAQKETPPGKSAKALFRALRQTFEAKVAPAASSATPADDTDP